MFVIECSPTVHRCSPLFTGCLLELFLFARQGKIMLKVTMAGREQATAGSEKPPIINNTGTTSTTGSTEAASVARIRGFLPQLFGAAASCLFSPVAAAAACDAEIVISVNAQRFPLVRFSGPAADALVCRNLAVPFTGIAGLTAPTTPFDTLPRQGRCLYTSSFKRETIETCSFDLPASTTVAYNYVLAKLYINDVETEASSSCFGVRGCGSNIDVKASSIASLGLDSLFATTVSPSDARFAVYARKGAVSCSFLFTAVAGFATNGFTWGDKDSFCGKTLVSAGDPTPNVTSCSTGPITAEQLDACVQSCRCIDNVKQCACNAAPVCWDSDPSARKWAPAPEIGCRASWAAQGQECKKTSCAVLCSVKDGCKPCLSGAPCGSIDAECTCQTPQACQWGAGSASTTTMLAVSAAVVAIVFLF
jgi:hypothetical protein